MATNADAFVVERVNIQKAVFDGGRMSCWSPASADQGAVLTKRFDFPEPVLAAYVRLSADVGLSVWNYGWAYGEGSLHASKDGQSWERILDAPTPTGVEAEAFYDYDELLPASVLGTKTLWLQARLKSVGLSDKVQFLRHSAENASQCFTLKARWSGPKFTGVQVTGDGRMRLRLVGPKAGEVEIQTSTNLSRWWTLHISTNWQGALEFDDSITQGSQHLFYRAVLRAR